MSIPPPPGWKATGYGVRLERIGHFPAWFCTVHYLGTPMVSTGVFFTRRGARAWARRVIALDRRRAEWDEQADYWTET